MNKRLKDEANMRIKDDDVCIHVGDFSMKDGWRYRQLLHGNWLFLRGNHDKNNKVKTVADWMFLRLSHFRVFVSHVPYFYRDEAGTADYLLGEDMIALVEKTCDFAVCGHIHEKWQVSFEGKIPTINVGVDVHNYRPINDEELLNIFTQTQGGKVLKEWAGRCLRHFPMLADNGSPIFSHDDFDCPAIRKDYE